MAISYVGGVVAGRTGNSNATVDVALDSGLTGGSNSGVSAGDLVVVTVCTASAARSSVVAVTSPATYVNLTAQRTTATTYDTNVQVSYKFMPSTPDSVVTIPAQGNIADGQAYAVQVFRGVNSTTPMDTTATYATGSGTNNRPNPAAITPVTSGAWIVVTGGGAAATGVNYTTATLTDFLTESGADTNDATVGVGYYTAWTSGAYDPEVFGGGSVNAANSWGATTIALRPAPETQTLTPTLYTNTETHYTHTVSVGTVSLTANLYENVNSFYIPVVFLVNQDLVASLYENSNTFYTPNIGRGAVSLSASLYSNTNIFYNPSVTPGVVGLTASLFSNTNTYYSLTISVAGGAVSGYRLLENGNDFRIDEASNNRVIEEFTASGNGAVLTGIADITVYPKAIYKAETLLTGSGNITAVPKQYFSQIYQLSGVGTINVVPSLVLFTSSTYVKYNGTWTIASPFVKHNGIWKTPVKQSIKVSGNWKRVY